MLTNQTTHMKYIIRKLTLGCPLSSAPCQNAYAGAWTSPTADLKTIRK